SDRDRLLTLAEVRRALDLPLHEQLLHLVLEEPYLDHRPEPRGPVGCCNGAHDIASFRSVGSGRSDSASPTACLTVSRNRAASPPSTARWSALSVAVSTDTASGRPFRSATRSTGLAVARIATCGGVTIAVNALTSNMPRLLSVNVASLSSSGRSLDERAR